MEYPLVFRVTLHNRPELARYNLHNARGQWQGHAMQAHSCGAPNTPTPTLSTWQKLRTPARFTVDPVWEGPQVLHTTHMQLLLPTTY